MARDTKPGEAERLLLTLPEAARLCGFSRSHAYALVARGEWPALRAGRTVRVPRLWLEDWIRGQIEAWRAARGRDGGDAA